MSMPAIQTQPVRSAGQLAPSLPTMLLIADAEQTLDG